MNRNKPEKSISRRSLHRLRRVLHMSKRVPALLFACVLFLSGCKSILVSGDLSFTAYAPVEPSGAGEYIHDLVYKDVDMGKYNIEGTSAFWMPPYHLNPIYVDNSGIEENSDAEPVMAEFNAIDYNRRTGRFVYAYLTPYFGPQMSDKVKSAGALFVPEQGNSNGITLPTPAGSKKGPGGYVETMMLYEPGSGNYKVLFSKYFNEDEYKINQPKLLTGKVEGSDAYFLFDTVDKMIRIYDITGKLLSASSYASMIGSMEVRLIESQQSWSFVWNYPYRRTTVTDVQIDEDFYVYFTIQIEASRKPFDQVDQQAQAWIDEGTDDYDEDDDDDEGEDRYEEINDVVYINGSFSTFNLNIGGEDCSLKFQSSIKEEALNKAIEGASLSAVTFSISGSQAASARSAIASDRESAAKARGEDTTGVDYSKGISDEDVLSYAVAMGWTNGEKTRLHDLYSSDDYYKTLERYWEVIGDDINKGYTIFDTSGLLDEGIELYYALSGVPDIRNGYIVLPDGNSVKFQNPVDNSLMPISWSTGAMRTMFYMNFNMDLRQRHSTLASFLASRSVTSSDVNSDFPKYLFMSDGEYERLIKSHESSLISSGNLLGYFSRYGDTVYYPWLTPGNFTKDVYDTSFPLLRRVSESPYEMYAESTQKGDDGFYYYNDPYRSNNAGKPDRLLKDGYPTVMVYGAEEYNSGKSYGKYMPVLIMRGYNSYDNMVYPLPRMDVVDVTQTEVTLPINVTYGNAEINLEVLKCNVELPTKYRMVFPEGAQISCSGNIWPNDAVKAVEGLGCVTYGRSSRYYRLYDDMSKSWYSFYYGLPFAGHEKWFITSKQDAASGSTVSYYPYLMDEAPHSYIRQMRNKMDGKIFDQWAIGTATDAGTYTAADGTKMVVLFTDKGMREYLFDGNRYYAYHDAFFDDIRTTSGYGLSVDESSKQENSTVTEEVNEQALNQELKYSFMSDNVCPYSTTQFMVFQNDSGIKLYDMAGETLMPLLTGHYYRIYDTDQPGVYTVLGFQTGEYEYTASDIAMAKFYTINLGNLIEKKSSENINTYLDGLRDYYLSATHSIRYVKKEGETEGTYEIVDPNPEDKDYSRACRLFTGSDTDTLNELSAICTEYSITPTKEMQDHALELVKNIRLQRQALNDYYELIGLQMPGGNLPDSWQYLKYESSVFTASYEGMLEVMLVEMVLSDEYLDPKISHYINGMTIGFTPEGTLSEEYAEYRRQYREWQKTRLETEQLVGTGDGAVDIQGMDSQTLQDTIIDLYKQRDNADDMAAISQMEFYKSVLGDIKSAYEERNDVLPMSGFSENDVQENSWDTFMNNLFVRISPDYGQDAVSKMKDSGYELFYTISLLPKGDKDTDILPWGKTELYADIAACRYDWQLEEVIVKYTLKTAAYHDNDTFQRAWMEYRSGSYDDLDAQEAAFKRSPCYGIIAGLKDKALQSGLGTDWENAVEDVLRKAGNAAYVGG